MCYRTQHETHSLSYTAGRLLSGQNIPDPTDPQTWLVSFFRGGSAFIYGAFLEGFLRKHQDIIKTFGGRGISMLDDVGRFMEKMIRGSNNDRAKSFIKFIRYNMPLSNLFFIKAIMDRAIFDELQQAVDPTFKYKLKRKLAKQNIHLLHLPH